MAVEQRMSEPCPMPSSYRGSTGLQVFDDKYLDKEENSRLMDFAFKWLRPVWQMVTFRSGSRLNAIFRLLQSCHFS
jgi:hypothetical protein